MIGNVLSSQPAAFVAQYPAVRNVPPQSNAASTPAEDSVQLSSQFQESFAPQQASAAAPPSLGQTIKEAAGGDIAALARLVLIA